MHLNSLLKITKQIVTYSDALYNTYLILFASSFLEIAGTLKFLINLNQLDHWDSLMR